jgi:4-nitrophenyl phosphatase
MRTYALYILDLDGTLFRGDEPLPGAVHAVSELRRRGAMIRLLTNNSSLTSAGYAAKLARMGFGAEPAEVWHSGLGAARVCTERGHRRVLAVGEPGLDESLSEAGLKVLDPLAEEGADAVVAGICRTFTYARLNAALQQLRRGARFIATNADRTYPVECGREEPGAGAIVAAIAAAASVEPEVIGKPNPHLIEMILREAGVAPADALVVGDRPETDLEAGRRAGCPTWLVLTGVARAPVPGQPGSADLTGLL